MLSSQKIHTFHIIIILRATTNQNVLVFDTTFVKCHLDCEQLRAFVLLFVLLARTLVLCLELREVDIFSRYAQVAWGFQGFALLLAH